ncbi:MAG: DUF5067 domain-containing protein [Eggerthellaceae bacterium]|nr:DUF5067 domain-containing protein [Eggerthellaceae bacterium]
MKRTKMHVLVAFALSFALALCLTACSGGEKTTEPTGGSAGEPGVVEDPGTSENPDAGDDATSASLARCEWSGSAGDLALEIVGAELFSDVNGSDGIRVYYDIYNDEGNIFTTSFADELDGSSFMQDGVELDWTWPYEDVPEWYNDMLSIRPGHAIRCVEEYSVSADGGPVSVALYARNASEPMLTHEFDLANLPGAPADALENAEELSPQWLAGWPSEGIYHDDYYIAITGYEIVKGYRDEPILRVFMDFTNNSEDVESLEYTIYWNRAYQDGIQIRQGVPIESCEEDGNYMIDVAPGETVSAAYCYELRGNSPVEVELIDPWADGISSEQADGGIGMVIDIA